MKSKHTDEQLSWLRGHLAEYENRAGGNVRGDAKKFALEKAVKYIEKWGVPDGEKETTMKEVRPYTIWKQLAGFEFVVANLHLVQKYIGQREGSKKEASAHEEFVMIIFISGIWCSYIRRNRTTTIHRLSHCAQY
jgi:hypothetical protein